MAGSKITEYKITGITEYKIIRHGIMIKDKKDTRYAGGTCIPGIIFGKNTDQRISPFEGGKSDPGNDDQRIIRCPGRSPQEW